MAPEEKDSPNIIPNGWRPYQLTSLISGAYRENTTVSYEYDGKIYHPGPNSCWKTTVEGLNRLATMRRIQKAGKTIRYVRYLDDFPAYELTNVWDDVAGAPDKLYVVQVSTSVVARCLLMTTDPGDLVLDPTCGSGTTAYVAEQWGRRWITIDTSRVPLALARQRLLTATFPWYQLKDEDRGPAGGFVYKRKQNNRGEEVGGIVPHVTLKSIANDEPPAEEVLVDRPEVESSITRVSGHFAVEATIPTPNDWEDDAAASGPRAAAVADDGNFAERMLEILRRSPVLRLDGNRAVTLKNVRAPVKSLSLSAEAVVVAATLEGLKEQADPQSRLMSADEKLVAFVFGPENGAIAERLVSEALREAYLRGFSHLYVIGFAIQPNARELIEHAEAINKVPATYVQATPDLMMGDLLKNMRSSQIFSVCGLPEIAVSKTDDGRYQVELIGLDVFDPIDDGGRSPSRFGRACVVSRHRLQRALLSRLPSVFPSDRRVGQPQESAQGRLRRRGLGPSFRDDERSFRAGRPPSRRRESDRRSRQRAARGSGDRPMSHGLLFPVIPDGLETVVLNANPWWRGERIAEVPPMRRWAFEPIKQSLANGLAPATVLRGPRQIGKTTLLIQIIEDLIREGIAPRRLFRLQFDDLPGLAKMSMPLVELTDWYASFILKTTLNQAAVNGEAPFLFFDEVQNLKDSAPQLKHLVDLGRVRALVTGSSALRIEAGRDSLAGRIRTFEMGPLLLREIAALRGFGEIPPYLPHNGLEPLKEKSFWLGLRAHGETHREAPISRSRRSTNAGRIRSPRFARHSLGNNSPIS